MIYEIGTASKVTGFHNYSDLQGTMALAVVQKHVITQKRELSYRFYPHFHPYVSRLITHMVEESVRGLQRMDTEYETDDTSPGTLKVLPDSTLVELMADGEVECASGGKLTVTEGTQVILPDGTSVKLPESGEVVKLPGSMVITESRGMRFHLSDGSSESVDYGKTLTLEIPAKVWLPTGELVTIAAGTVVKLLNCKPQPELYAGFFKDQYNPSEIVERPYPVKDLDFDLRGAYSVYNWELFYHVPITLAIHLSKNQRFAEAQQWLHYIFDPSDDSDGPTPERFWKVRPFQYTDVKLIGDILVNLSSGADPALKQETIDCIRAWRDAPFRPHVVARYRQTAYMFKAVMSYLDNLIAWGDSLFRQDTRETINEAMQLYVLAMNILGPHPQAVPKKDSVRPKTYANLRDDLDKFDNVLQELETDIPFDLTPHPGELADSDRFSTLQSLGREALGRALYFCVPRNDKLLDYWEKVADRLFKIRNSLNIMGIFRQLPLFEPPIDPGLLAKAAAAGLDIGAVVSGANQPLPLVRFQFMIQKAAEICQEVKSLGGSLLSVMEKEDNESLAILRAKHEQVILGLAETVKYSQYQEAIKAREALEVSLKNAAERYTYYERLLGEKDEDIKKKIPELDALDTAALEKMKFKADEPQALLRDVEVDIAQNLGESGGKLVSSHEANEMEKLSEAQTIHDTVGTALLLAKALALLPDFGVDFHFWGVGGNSSILGGTKFGQLHSFVAEAERVVADRFHYEANRAAKIGSYARREQEWAFQSNLIAGEITQILKQLRAAQIREAIAEREWKNHKKQIEHAKEIEQFLTDERKGKKTNKDFYTWMKREVKGLHSQCFQFAFDVAKKAERALQHELGDPMLSFLQFGYLSGKEGLLAGEKLHLDIKRMEMAYHDLNQREYELTKHVSLLQVNPKALLQLRATGRCTVCLPEELFDMDCPGHYFRRIKSAAVSIPCVIGPYASINCTVTLLKSSIRKSQLLREGYAREGSEDDRFSDYFGSLQSIVTSSGQNDNGLFETNLRDERYLPFEGSGVISEWQLELPANPSKNDPCQFDYETISEVILHLHYTAREGGMLLRNGAIANLKSLIDEAEAGGSVRLFSVKHEFPTEWANFKSIEAGVAKLTLDLHEEHYPFWSKGRLEAIKHLDIFAKTKTPGNPEVTVTTSGGEKKVTLSKDPSYGELRVGSVSKESLPKPSTPIDSLVLSFGDSSITDLWLALKWGKEE
jgi:hypothetical protein